MTHIGDQRLLELIAAAIQVPVFLIARRVEPEGEVVLTDPLYYELLRRWTEADPPVLPTPQMAAFVFALASALRADLLVRNVPQAHPEGRFRFTPSRVSRLHIEMMINWMCETPLVDVAVLTKSWSRELGASATTDTQAALAWQLVHAAPGFSFCTAHGGTLPLQAEVDDDLRLCGHRWLAPSDSRH